MSLSLLHMAAREQSQILRKPQRSTITLKKNSDQFQKCYPEILSVVENCYQYFRFIVSID